MENVKLGCAEVDNIYELLQSCSWRSSTPVASASAGARGTSNAASALNVTARMIRKEDTWHDLRPQTDGS